VYLGGGSGWNGSGGRNGCGGDRGRGGDRGPGGARGRGGKGRGHGGEPEKVVQHQNHNSNLNQFLFF